MYKIRTILEVYNKDQSLSEKLMPLVEEKQKMINRMCEEIAETTDRFCLHKKETNCDCSDCDCDCEEEVYNFFEREAGRERKNGNQYSKLYATQWRTSNVFRYK